MKVEKLYELIGKLSPEERKTMNVNVVYIDDVPDSGEHTNVDKAVVIDMTTDSQSKKQLCIYSN